jgi:hypothetical protein
MQGATVEHATVVAVPHDLTRGWSYTALSRARGETRLLIRDTSPEAGDRDAISPTAAASPAARPVDVLARVASRMLERDDEDLAIDQLAAGRHDDPQLVRPPDAPVQEDAAARTEPTVHPSEGAGRMRELRDTLRHPRAQLAALPVRELDQLDNLDAQTIELTERRDAILGRLERIPDPPRRRFGRSTDPHIVKRTQLSSAHRGIETQLDRALADRAALARVLGDVESIRSERDGLATAITSIRNEHRQLRDDLADREVNASPRWLRDALGDRPNRTSEGRRWDRAAQALTRYRVEYDIPLTRAKCSIANRQTGNSGTTTRRHSAPATAPSSSSESCRVPTSTADEPQNCERSPGTRATRGHARSAQWDHAAESGPPRRPGGYGGAMDTILEVLIIGPPDEVDDLIGRLRQELPSAAYVQRQLDVTGQVETYPADRTTGVQVSIPAEADAAKSELERAVAALNVVVAPSDEDERSRARAELLGLHVIYL